MKGSCLCGAVEYEIDQLDGAIGHCHCRTYRKAHAAAFKPAADVNRDHFRWIKGRHKLSSFETSAGKFRYFCSICGSHVLSEDTGDGHVSLSVATLDEDPGARPRANVWTSHDVPWLSYPSLRRYPEWPPGGKLSDDPQPD